MTLQIATQRMEIRFRALAGNEAQLHQLARSIIDKDQQRARICTIFEPTMLAAIDLDQLAIVFAPETWLMKASSLFTRQPHPRLDHPFTQCFAGDFQTMPL